MPFERPTLRQLIDRFRADIRAYTDGGDALLRRSVESVLARIVPGLTHGLHGHVAWVARQILPSTCEPPQVLRWASMLGLTLRPAAPAISVAAFATTGPTIPVSTLVRRGDGVRYVTTSERLDNGSVIVDLVAEVPGAHGNAPPGISVELVSPIAGVNSEGLIIDPNGIHDGVDIEDVDTSLRARVIQRLRNPPRGGGRGDYVAWALEVPGVTRAWEYPRIQGAGTVGVLFVTDGEFAGPIPSPAKIGEVQEYLAERAPVTIGRSINGEWVGVIVGGPEAHVVDIQIANLRPDTQEVRDAIDAELRDFFRRETAPGATLPLSRLDEAISGAPGEISHTLVSPSTDIVPDDGALPILGEITFV